MKNGILEDLLALAEIVNEELERGNLDAAKEFTNHIIEGLKLNIKNEE